MEQIISKKELEELEKIKGEVRGLGMQTHANFILEKEGKEAVKKMEEVMGELGYPVSYEKIQRMKFYPLKLEALTLLIIKKLFRYDRERFKEIGRFHAKISSIFRFFLKKFLSFEKIARGIPNVWGRYFKQPGEFEVLKFSKEDKEAVFRIKNFHFYPLHCHVMEGVFEGLIPIVSGDKGTCREVKCVHHGDEYHEFHLKW
ncbi:MAG: hypothetical protein GF370_02880 [Candidatus Nealsonbacteria bacterium]|nr:hypothetical protein [Candidatus Nealsonbacteria bacterium]